MILLFLYSVKIKIIFIKKILCLSDPNFIEIYIFMKYLKHLNLNFIWKKVHDLFLFKIAFKKLMSPYIHVYFH